MTLCDSKSCQGLLGTKQFANVDISRLEGADIRIKMREATATDLDVEGLLDAICCLVTVIVIVQFHLAF